MNINYLYKYLLLVLCLSAPLVACNDDQEIFFENVIGDDNDIEVVHPSLRDKPYPSEKSELYLNPSPLLVPKAVRAKDEKLEFELS